MKENEKAIRKLSKSLYLPQGFSVIGENSTSLFSLLIIGAYHWFFSRHHESLGASKHRAPFGNMYFWVYKEENLSLYIFFLD